MPQVAARASPFPSCSLNRSMFKLPAALHPCLVGLRPNGPDQPQTAGLLRKDQYHQGALLDLLVKSFQQVGAVQVRGVR